MYAQAARLGDDIIGKRFGSKPPPQVSWTPWSTGTKRHSTSFDRLRESAGVVAIVPCNWLSGPRVRKAWGLIWGSEGLGATGWVALPDSAAACTVETEWAANWGNVPRVQD